MKMEVSKLEERIKTAQSSADMAPVMSVGALFTGALLVYILTN